MTKVIVDEGLLDLILLNAIRGNGLSKPEFKVDKSMGEGTPSTLEVEYRQKLLDALQRFHKATNKVFRGGDSWDEKLKKIDFLTQDYISTAQQYPMEYIPQILEQGIKKAEERLEEIDIIPPEIDTLDNPYLAVTLHSNRRKLKV